jgi:RimJ/RimL family protein N-acetyltransferase
MNPEVTLRRAARPDIEAIMAIERRPGFESLISRSSFAEHEAMLASREYAYFVGLDPQQAIVAFAILRDLEDRYGNLYLKRVAVFEPNSGVGFAFLQALANWAFRETAAHRFWLSTFDSNVRAQRVYEKLGFTRDGVLREAYLGADGRRRDLTMMALLRPEWDRANRAPL